MTTTIYTNPVTSVAVIKETKDNFKPVSLPYVISANFGGKNLLTVDLLPFVKNGKKSIDPYFNLTVDGNYNVSMKINPIPNTKGYLTSKLGEIVNLSETVINHWLTQPVINNNGNVAYFETYLLAYAILPLIKTGIEGNLTKKVGYSIRIEKLAEYDVFKAWDNVVSVCPLTQAILTATRDHFATLTPPITQPKPELTQETIDQHQNLADNQPQTNPVTRTDTGNNSESLPELNSFDEGVINYNQLTDKFNSNPESLKQLELIELAKSLNLTASNKNSKRELQNMINSALMATV